MHRPPRGTTVAELLITALIIAVLAIAGFAVFARTAAATRQTQCASHLQQAGIATLNLIADSNQRIQVQIGGGNLTRGWTKSLVTQKYLTRESAFAVLRCPSAKIQHSRIQSGNWYWETYGMNMYKHPQSSFIPYEDAGFPCYLYDLSVLAVQYPADHLLLSDSSNGVAPEHWQSHSLKTRDSKAGVALRHNGRANAFYLDGHMEVIDRKRAEASAVSVTQIYEISDNRP